MSATNPQIPLDAHIYEIWANGGVDPWPSSDLAAVKGTFLCYGPRGCGKTFLADAFFAASGKKATKLDSVFILKNPDKHLQGLGQDVSDYGGLLVEDIDIFLTSLRSWPSAWHYFLEVR